MLAHRDIQHASIPHMPGHLLIFQRWLEVLALCIIR